MQFNFLSTFCCKFTGTFDPINITGIVTALSNVSHTVSLWTKTVNGTATNTGWDEGCLPQELIMFSGGV